MRETLFFASTTYKQTAYANRRRVHEYANNINSYLSGLELSAVRNIKELIDWNTAHADIEMPYEHSNQERLVKSYEDVPDVLYGAVRKTYEAAIAHLRKVAVKDSFDFLFSGDKALDIVAIPMDSKIPSMATASGYPIATMPLGVFDYLGRPFGLAIIAKAGWEDLIFRSMSAFEATFPKRAI
ncbi:hypothetical protein BDV95DRAFT_574534 [Massariosphaeria phaeospora]|uniref:Amidase signature domain-containing protein n=1 Tax=Massariosphaeria phaeospora TaxID=100035 RepID=A0A7C8IDZ0_9PLEO|nr:hypothetical protein BDV95DRAFT_574534 [Massariosphaeria phaeospora]